MRFILISPVSSYRAPAQLWEQIYPYPKTYDHFDWTNLSASSPISFAIRRKSIGDISLPLWKGTVVALPSGWRDCLCEPRCRTAL